MGVPFTPKQGQYLAFIYYYTKLNGSHPLKRICSATSGSAPTVHQMVKKLAEAGLIERTPGAPRSVRVLLELWELPHLE